MSNSGGGFRSYTVYRVEGQDRLLNALSRIERKMDSLATKKYMAKSTLTPRSLRVAIGIYFLTILVNVVLLLWPAVS